MSVYKENVSTLMFNVLYVSAKFVMDFLINLFFWIYFTVGFIVIFMPVYFAFYLINKKHGEHFQYHNYLFFKIFFFLPELLSPD